MSADRPRPEDFLDLVRRSREGRLKVFLGPAAGVGKTYRMLQEARELTARGVDIVLGVVVTHGRAETAALMEGLEAVPPNVIEYRGMTLEEMDLDGVLRRAPEVVVIDEVAHTNAPGSRNRRRYEDVLECLRAGINVFCAFNVQHLESLNDMVRRATGVTVRETVPDSFLARADQIVNIDLPAEDLLERLHAGKIYAPERVPWAVEHFFRPENLQNLRELALREVAEALDREQKRSLEREQPAARRDIAGRLMLCLASRSPHAKAFLRKGSRMAGRLNVHWFAVYVQTPREGPLKIDATTQRYLADAQQMARELGAEVHRVQSEDPVDGILEFARANGVSDILIGASAQPWWRQALGLSVAARLMQRAAGFDLHILSPDGVS